MSLSVAIHQARAYQVSTPVYEGPLDLLLQLIERAELDITKVALAQVTAQYLARFHEIKAAADVHQAEEVSAFMVIAARLVQIKSEALLPRPPRQDPREEDADPGEALARQLLAYKQFKEIAQYLAAREERGWRTYLRLAAPPKIEGRLDMAGLGLDDLREAGRVVFGLVDQEPLHKVVAAPKITIREKIKRIAGLMRAHGRVQFRQILGTMRSRLDVVVSFLAVLELVKRRSILVTQKGMFAEILLEPSESWMDTDDFELEFGE